MTDEWHSYTVGRISPSGKVEMFDESIDNGPGKPMAPWDFIPVKPWKPGPGAEVMTVKPGEIAEITIVDGPNRDR